MGRVALSAAIVVFGGFGWLAVSWFLALFRCSWDVCTTGHQIAFIALLVGGAVALVAVLRAVWRQPPSRPSE